MRSFRTAAMARLFFFFFVAAAAAATTTVSGLEQACDLTAEEPEVLTSGANDVVVVQQADGRLRSTPFHVQIGKLNSWRTLFRSRRGRLVEILVDGRPAPVKMTIVDSGRACFTRKRNKHSLTSQELAGLGLKPGGNLALYRVPSLNIEIRFIVYLLGQDDRLVLTDVDGTITESDVRGVVSPYFGVKADHEHIVRLLHRIGENGYKVIYLTARPLGYDQETREYLFKSLQSPRDGGPSLPYGPLFMSPKSDVVALYEGLTGPNVQKTSTLRSLLRLFDFGHEVVAAAFGNTNEDTVAYLDAGIDPQLIYMVNEAGRVRNAADGRLTTYRELADAADDMFPKLGGA